MLLRNCADDRELAREIVVSVMADMPAKLGDLEEAVASADWAAASRTAHTMKGLAAQIGGMPLSERLRAAEHTLRAGGAIDQATLDAIRRSYGTLERRLGTWLSA